ncbi:hypothetical protein [Parapedobacter sp.]
MKTVGYGILLFTFPASRDFFQGKVALMYSLNVIPDRIENRSTVILAIIILVLAVLFFLTKRRRSRWKGTPVESEQIKRELFAMIAEQDSPDWDDSGYFVYGHDEVRINRGLLINEKFNWSAVTTLSANIPKMEFFHDRYRIKIQLLEGKALYVDEEEPGFYHFLKKIKHTFPTADISFIEQKRNPANHLPFSIYQA